MTVFVDTSALLALLNPQDRAHQAATRRWQAFEDLGDELMTHGYVVLETVSLVQRRHGFESAEAFLDELLPAIDVLHLDEALHDQALAAFRAARSRTLSLVDQVSFAFMRRLGIRHVFGFDGDFAAQGFIDAG